MARPGCASPVAIRRRSVGGHSEIADPFPRQPTMLGGARAHDHPRPRPPTDRRRRRWRRAGQRLSSGRARHRRAGRPTPPGRSKWAGDPGSTGRGVCRQAWPMAALGGLRLPRRRPRPAHRTRAAERPSRAGSVEGVGGRPVRVRDPRRGSCARGPPPVGPNPGTSGRQGRPMRGSTPPGGQGLAMPAEPRHSSDGGGRVASVSRHGRPRGRRTGRRRLRRRWGGHAGSSASMIPAVMCPP